MAIFGGLIMSNIYQIRTARINLTENTITIEEIDSDLAQTYLGGRGLGTKILYDEGCAAADAFSPDNKLIYITGPLTGFGTPSSGRYSILTKSPLTGKLACSNLGGIWGKKLKETGWDALIIEGEAPEWRYLHITDEKIKILNAQEYMGMYSDELTEKLKEKHSKTASILSVGIAGENKVLTASIMNDRDRASGHSGIGAVMGSKKLKCIVITATHKKITPSPAEKYLIKSQICLHCPRGCNQAGQATLSDTEKWCNRYGLDVISFYSTMEIIRNLHQQGLLEPECLQDEDFASVNWIRRMSHPQTKFDKLISAGPSHLCETNSNKKKRDNFDKKSYLSKASLDLASVIDSIGLCLFTSSVLTLSDYTELINTTCGTSYSTEEILNINKQILHTEDLFNRAADT